MAKRNAPDLLVAEPELTVSRKEAAEKIIERIGKGRTICMTEIRTVEELAQCKMEFDRWDRYNNELLIRLFTTPKMAKEYSFWSAGIVRMHPPSSAEKVVELKKRAQEKIQRLESINDRLELIPVAVGIQGAISAQSRAHSNRVFIVHGHDDAVRETVARYLEKLGIEAIILHEQATGGRTIVEKLEHYSDVDFAVILLTPDDVGESKERATNLKARARQNVILELGYFVGKLGRSNVCALYKGPLELPTDYVGVGYISLDDAGGWRLGLAKELRIAKFDVDLNLAI